SPYSTRSACGFNPLYIDLSQLPGATEWTNEGRASLEHARAAPTVEYERVFPLKAAALERAFARFTSDADTADFERFSQEQAGWLDTFSLFAAISESQQHRAWWEWPVALARREAPALARARVEHARRIRFHAWLQWV